MKENKAHAKLSASGSERWLNCPGSVALEAKCPEQVESSYAIEGTKAHKLLELWALHILKNTTGFIIPKKYPEEMSRAVKIAIDLIKKKVALGYTILIEERIDLSFVGPDMFGTTDIGALLHFDTLEIWDYKHGQGKAVHVIDDSQKNYRALNTQLMYYALGLAHKYNFDFDKIKIGVVQPRASHAGGPIRFASVTVKDLKTYEDFFRRGIERTEKKDARRTPGPWCQWCRGKQKGPFQCKEWKRSLTTKMFEGDL